MPKSVLIVGGHGKVALEMTKMLVAEKHPEKYTVFSLIRNPAQCPELQKLGSFPVVQDVDEATVPELCSTLSRLGPDVVVWAAGAPGGASPERIDAVDHRAAVKLMDAVALASKAGHAGRRLVSISAIDLRDCDNKPVPGWYDDRDKELSARYWLIIRDHMMAKFRADRELRTGNATRGLDYTMVRPGELIDGPGEGVVSAGRAHLSKNVRREDVARVVVECIKNDGTIGLAFDVAGGEDMIARAVKRVADDRIDTFEGFY